MWYDTCKSAEYGYFRMMEDGATPQEARSVLPNSLKTTLIATYNIREWRHFLRLRCAPDAHPQMQQVAKMALEQLRAWGPVFFEDLDPELRG